MEKTFTDDNFDTEVIKSSAPVFIDFWAPWCGPCQMIGPIVDELANEYEETQVKIGKLNVDENQRITGKYEVMSVPTFIMIKNGEVVDKQVGVAPKNVYTGKIDAAM